MAKKMSDWYYSIPKELRKHLRIVLQGMAQRCYNEKMHSYPDYGGRGIRVCPEWYDAELNLIRTEPFMKWALLNGYKMGLQIDRIDNFGNYEPSNCRFVTPMENGRNKRNCKPITYKGETHCLSEWADILGVPAYVIKQRYQRGLPVEKILEKKVYSKDKVLRVNGRKVLLSEVAKQNGISRSLIRARIKQGWAVEDAVSTKPTKGHERVITYKGEQGNIKYFASKYGRNYHSVLSSLRSGKCFECAFEGLNK